LLTTSVLNGPLLSIRKLDPLTGKVIFNDVRSANAQGQNQKFALASFDAEHYVAEQWATDVESVITKNTVDLAQVLNAVSQNANEASNRYAVPHQTQSKNYIVSGRARITEVNTKSPMGLLSLELLDSPLPGTPKIQLLTGPLVISTALRDVASNMSLNNFTNQTQYADVAAALNKKALTQAYGTASASSLAGKTVEFTGVFNLQSPSSVRIVPISLKVEE
jgi:predicted lipoprotein